MHSFQEEAINPESAKDFCTVYPAGSLTASDDVIVPSLRLDRLTVEIGWPWLSTACPLAIATTTGWPAGSLKVSVPLSSASRPENGECYLPCTRCPNRRRRAAVH